MSRAFNFSAGPAALPAAVLEQVQHELLEWQGERASVMEVSHRGQAFIDCAAEAERDLRALMGVGGDYHALFLQGGATALAALLPLNLAGPDAVADYVLTGHWGEKALENARPSLRARVAATAKPEGYRGLPPRAQWELDPAAAYVHYTPNETIHGVEIHEVPEVGAVPLVADFSSSLLSRPVDVSRFGVIYGGAQKNLGPAGLTLVIVREDLLGHVRAGSPSLLDLKQQAEHDSMVNTPPTYAVYIAGLVFQWLKRQGGVAAIEQRNIQKANLLYDYLDATDFYTNPVAKADRSRMNIPFTLPEPALDAPFLAGAHERGLLQLKGHRSVGGMRASIYNAMPVAGVQALVDYMRSFEKRHG